MESETLFIKTKIQIAKPVDEVFEAIVNPEKMSNYFISRGSAIMESGKTIMWSFPEFDGEFPIKVQ
ncbi:ATPase, partial [Pseudoxanthomonas sp. SGD-10]